MRNNENCHALPVVVAVENVDELAMLNPIRRHEAENVDVMPEHERFLRERAARMNARRTGACEEDSVAEANGSSRRKES